MTRTRCARAAAIAGMVAVALLVFADEAAAEHVIIELAAPGEALLGEPVEIAATVRSAEDEEPVAGAVVIFYTDATFSGVSGEIELGRAITNSIGVATLTREFATTRTHAIRVETLDEPGSSPQSAAIAVAVTGEQLHTSEAGVSIPGVGGWVVVVIIGGVWGVMIIAALWVVALSRERDAEPSPLDPDSPDRFRGRRGPLLNIATVVTGVMILSATGLVVLLVRSPDTHANLNPEGYDRTAVAYVEASYVYPGLGPADLAGEQVADGRVLFVSAGCAGCHGLEAEGTAAARSPIGVTRDWLGQVVRSGLGGGMPAYAPSELSDADLDAIEAFLLAMGVERGTPTSTTVPDATPPSADGPEAAGEPTYTSDVLPIFQAECAGCHGTEGGWTSTDYQSVFITGDNAPSVVLPFNAEDSLLAQKVLGTQATGVQMPPSGLLSEDQISVIIDWIRSGARE